jgi:hypothetical protein
LAPQRISARKRSPSRWWGSRVPTTLHLGDPVTPNSWWSPTTPT